jgi:hypothetical protein
VPRQSYARSAMPTRKQRRRREKNRRHEWEYVYVDDEGREVEVEEDDAPAAKPAKPASKTSSRPATRAGRGGRDGGRKVDPPSWNRVLRRTAIFAPIMLLVIYFLRPENASAASLVVQLAVLLAFFLPFSYVMDVLMYRAYRKRIGDPLPPRGRKQGSR